MQENNYLKKINREIMTMCIYEPLYGEYPTDEQCKSGCGHCPFNVPDIPKPDNENAQDELPY